MKWYSLLTATVILALGIAASADEFGRYRATSAAQGHVANPFLGTPGPSYQQHAIGAGVFADFPPYPAGYTSYRGVGYQGYCCEQKSPCTENLWAGYCAGNGHCGSGGFGKGCGGFGKGCGGFGKGCGGGVKPCHRGLLNSGSGDRLGFFRCRPEWCCYPYSCRSGCAGPGANWWPVAQSCKTLGGRLRSMGDSCGTWVDDVMYGGTSVEAPGQAVPGPVPDPAPGLAPTPAAPQPTESTTPTSSYPGPRLPPAPQSIDMPDELPPLFPEDKSAWRQDFRRLPAVSVSY